MQAGTGLVGGAARPWRLSRSYLVLLAPTLLFLAVFFLWPLARVVVRGFVDPAPGLANYRQILGNTLYLQAIWNTVETAAVVTLLCVLVAYPVACAMAMARGGTLKAIAAIVIVPMWTSVVIRSYAWMVVFQRRGVLNDALQGLGFTDGPISFLPGGLAVHVGMVHIMLPFMILPLAAAVRGIDRTLLRAAEVMGAAPHQVFFRVFLPLSLPGVFAGASLVFMMSLGFFVTPALLGGPKHLTAVVLIEQQANQLLNWGLASALATLLLLVTVAIYMVWLRATRGSGAQLEPSR